MSYFWALRLFQMLTDPLFQVKLHLLSNVLLSIFHGSPGALKSTEWAATGKFHGSGRPSKCNCLQDRANFHRSRAWRIVLIFNTGYAIEGRGLVYSVNPQETDYRTTTKTKQNKTTGVSLRWRRLKCADRPQSSWWLQMSWRQIGARSSATIMLTPL